MVAERTSKHPGIGTRPEQVSYVPNLYNVEIAVDGRSDLAAIETLLRQLFVEGEDIAYRPGSRLTGRRTIVIGGFPREIAEARCETLRSRARVGHIDLSTCIRKALQ